MLWVPQTDGFPADCDPSLNKQIFDISVAEIEAVVEPDGVADDSGRESVAFHLSILPATAI
jgi:hypothetical protein